MARLLRALTLLPFAFLPTCLAQGQCTRTLTQSVDFLVEHQSIGSGNNAQNYMLINTKWPADAITTQICTWLTVNVNNKAGEDLTLHFHGLLQNDGQTISDGAQGLSQSAIPDQGTYTYTVFTGDRAGTHWIHSHSPGQYPKGVRAPLIVKNDLNDKSNYHYNTDEVMTVSDWWLDFGAAEARAKATDSTTCGEPNVGKNTWGIEYPSQKVVVNDVNGYNTALGKAAKTYKIDNCGTDLKRLRLINLSSHARFYIFFSDHRDFTVLEYDGIIFERRTTNFLGLASGQRASILVDGKSSTQGGKCVNAYIIAASDPKISHGTLRCPMDFTRSDRGVQYAHAYLEVNGNPITNTAVNLGAGDFPAADLIVWSAWRGDDPDRDMNFQFYPSGSWKATEAPGTDALAPARTAAGRIMNNRLDMPYRIMWYRNDHDTDYGPSKGGSRIIPAILGVGNAEDLQMAPVENIAAWDVDSTDYMHYITLSGVNASENGERGGFASMGEDLKGSIKNLIPWQDPEGGYLQQKGNLKFPSVFRALENVDEAVLTNMARYEFPGSRPGRTINIKDNRPNWFVIRSTLGDHPMHLHGHHFQILAKLPDKWFDNQASSLYNHLVNEGPTMGKASRINPPRRDTIMIEKGITYVIAIKSENPGVWAFHCHNDIHAVTGMFSQVISQPKLLRDKVGSWTALPATNGVLNFEFALGSVPEQRSRLMDNFNNTMKRYGYTDGQYTLKPKPLGSKKSKKRSERRARRRLFSD